MVDDKVNISPKLHRRVTEMRYFIIKQSSVVFSQNEFETRSAVKHELRKQFLPLGVAELGIIVCVEEREFCGSHTFVYFIFTYFAYLYNRSDSPHLR